MADESSSSLVPQKRVHWQPDGQDSFRKAARRDGEHCLLRTAIDAARAEHEDPQCRDINKYLLKWGGRQAWENGEMPDFFSKRHLCEPYDQSDHAFWREACMRLEINPTHDQDSEQLEASFYGGAEGATELSLHALLNTLWENMPGDILSDEGQATQVKLRILPLNITYKKVCCPTAMPARLTGQAD